MALIKIKQINNTPAVAGDVITFDGTNNVWSQPDQNLWETIVADSGSIIANTTTDTLSILGTPNETVTSAASDNLLIGIADNLILPGTESVTVPIGTTAQRPVTPVAGMQRWNSTLDCMEIYNGTEWECIRFQTSLVGGLYQMIFSVNGIIKNAWMDQGADNVQANSTPAIVLAKSKLVAFTFTNSRTNVDTDLEVYRTPEGISPTATQDLLITWELSDVRTSRRSSFVTDIIFNAGDKIGVFSKFPGAGSINPNDAIFILFLQYLEENNEEVIDNTSGDMDI